MIKKEEVKKERGRGKEEGITLIALLITIIILIILSAVTIMQVTGIESVVFVRK